MVPVALSDVSPICGWDLGDRTIGVDSSAMMYGVAKGVNGDLFVFQLAFQCLDGHRVTFGNAELFNLDLG